MTLDEASFAEFFDAVHRPASPTNSHDNIATAREPYPWQRRLAAQALNGDWPDSIHIPTGLGKTGALTVAVFCMAVNPTAPTRVIYVVDRRTVVDAAYDGALRMQKLLAEAPEGTLLNKIASRLRKRSGLFGEVQNLAAPLVVSRLRGGGPRDDQWAQSPVTPAVILGTVDQIGSRILHRGYGVSRKSRPIHAGLLGMDSLLLLDEPHLSVPFLQTLQSLREYQPRDSTPHRAPVRTVVLGATLPPTEVSLDRPSTVLELDHSDQNDPAIRRHLDVRKPLKLAFARTDSVEKLVEHAIGQKATRIAVMVNTVNRARNIAKTLKKYHTVELVIGRSRPGDRLHIEKRLRDKFGPDSPRGSVTDDPVIVVATQTLEVGADLSFDTVISEAAPWPNLVQRAGRLHRRPEPHDGSFIVVPASVDLGAYGTATAETVKSLKSWVAAHGDNADMGYHGIRTAQETPDLITEKCYPPPQEAPIMLPEHVSTWAQTSPEPAVDLAVEPFLHGVTDRVDDVRFFWRNNLTETLKNASIHGEPIAESALGLDVLPPRDIELLEIPVGAARAFLRGTDNTSVVSDDATTSDIPRLTDRGTPKPFLVKTNDGWVSRQNAIKPGALVLLDVSAGGLLLRTAPKDSERSSDNPEFSGWDPSSTTPVVDISEGAASPTTARFTLNTLIRKAHDFGIPWHADTLEQLQVELEKLSTGDLSRTERRKNLAETIDQMNDELSDFLNFVMQQEFENPDYVISQIVADDLKPGWVENGRPADWVITVNAHQCVKVLRSGEQTITEHGKQVGVLAQAAVNLLGLPDGDDLVLAARHHDAGKCRPQWQTYIKPSETNEDPAECFGDTKLLAKSGTNPSREARERQRLAAGLERGWRHEALSAKLLSEHNASDLTVHLAGAHHGHGRPFYPTTIPGRPEQVVHSQQVARFESLMTAYGPWGLSLREAIVRLSDWTASGHSFSVPLRKAVETIELPELNTENVKAIEPPRNTTIVYSALTADNLADYCTAVGILRMLARVEPLTTLHWHGTTPHVGWPGNVDPTDPALLRLALEQLVEFTDEIKTISDGEVIITGGQSGVNIETYRKIARRFRTGSLDAQAWLAGCHNEAIRQSSDITKVAPAASTIWTRGRTSPWAQIETASTDYHTSLGEGRRAKALRTTIDHINEALLTRPGKLHLLREQKANTYGLDFRSGSYRAKADRDAGYVPFLVAFAHLGFNTLFRARTRLASVNGSRRPYDDPRVLDIWLREEPLTLAGLKAALSTVRSSQWLGDSTQHLQTHHISTGNRADFYGQARPAMKPKQK